MISKEEYVLNRIKNLAVYYAKESQKIKPLSLMSLIDQWEFDYEMDKKYRPDVLSEQGRR